MPSTRAADLKSGVILFRQQAFIKPTVMKIQTIVLAVAGIVCLASAGLPAQQQASGNLVSCGAPSCPYLNPALAPEARAKDLVSRMTLEEKVSQMQDVAPAIPRLGVPAYNWWNEALHGVARNGFATNFPQSIGLAATWDTGADAPDRDGHRRRRPRQVQRGDSQRRSQPLRRPHVLVAEHQYRPRSALGPRHGDLWRGSVPDREPGSGVRRRPCRATIRSIWSW